MVGRRPAAVASSSARRLTEVSMPVPTFQARASRRSEEHTSELQSQSNLVCRLLLEKKKKIRRAQSDTSEDQIQFAPAVTFELTLLTPVPSCCGHPGAGAVPGRRVAPPVTTACILERR